MEVKIEVDVVTIKAYAVVTSKVLLNLFGELLDY
jgi:hypothetical protein